MSPYVYRGTQRDVKTPAPATVRPPSTPGPKPKPTALNQALCGTYAGYKQHEKTRTEKCQPCKTANAAYSRDYEARRKTGNVRTLGQGFNPDACGTRTGYRRHKRHKIPSCGPCREANRLHAAEHRAKRKAAA